MFWGCRPLAPMEAKSSTPRAPARWPLVASREISKALSRFSMKKVRSTRS